MAQTSPAIPLPGTVVEAAAAVPALRFAKTLAEHDRGLVLHTKRTNEFAALGRKAIVRFATGGDGFSPMEIGSACRKTGLERHGEQKIATRKRWSH